MTRDARLSALTPWRFWAPVLRFAHRHFAPDRLQRAPRAPVVVPGWRGPVPPETPVPSRRPGTPRLAPPSGCLLTTPFDERGCESLRWSLFADKRNMCLIAAAIRRRLESRA